MLQNPSKNTRIHFFKSTSSSCVKNCPKFCVHSYAIRINTDLYFNIWCSTYRIIISHIIKWWARPYAENSSLSTRRSPLITLGCTNFWGRGFFKKDGLAYVVMLIFGQPPFPWLSIAHIVKISQVKQNHFTVAWTLHIKR